MTIRGRIADKDLEKYIERDKKPTDLNDPVGKIDQTKAIKPSHQDEFINRKLNMESVTNSKQLEDTPIAASTNEEFEPSIRGKERFPEINPADLNSKAKEKYPDSPQKRAEWLFKRRMALGKTVAMDRDQNKEMSWGEYFGAYRTALFDGTWDQSISFYDSFGTAVMTGVGAELDAISEFYNAVDEQTGGVISETLEGKTGEVAEAAMPVISTIAQMAKDTASNEPREGYGDTLIDWHKEAVEEAKKRKETMKEATPNVGNKIETAVDKLKTDMAKNVPEEKRDEFKKAFDMGEFSKVYDMVPDKKQREAMVNVLDRGIPGWREDIPDEGVDMFMARSQREFEDRLKATEQTGDWAEVATEWALWGWTMAGAMQYLGKAAGSTKVSAAWQGMENTAAKTFGARSSVTNALGFVRGVGSNIVAGETWAHQTLGAVLEGFKYELPWFVLNDAKRAKDFKSALNRLKFNMALGTVFDLSLIGGIGGTAKLFKKFGWTGFVKESGSDVFKQFTKQVGNFEEMMKNSDYVPESTYNKVANRISDLYKQVRGNIDEKALRENTEKSVRNFFETDKEMKTFLREMGFGTESLDDLTIEEMLGVRNVTEGWDKMIKEETENAGVIQENIKNIKQIAKEDEEIVKSSSKAVADLKQVVEENDDISLYGVGREIVEDGDEVIIREGGLGDARKINMRLQKKTKKLEDLINRIEASGKENFEDLTLRERSLVFYGDDLQNIPGIGPKTAKQLKELNISTPSELADTYRGNLPALQENLNTRQVRKIGNALNDPGDELVEKFAKGEFDEPREKLMQRAQNLDDDIERLRTNYREVKQAGGKVNVASKANNVGQAAEKAKKVSGKTLLERIQDSGYSKKVRNDAEEYINYYKKYAGEEMSPAQKGVITKKRNKLIDTLHEAGMSFDDFEEKVALKSIEADLEIERPLNRKVYAIKGEPVEQTGKQAKYKSEQVYKVGDAETVKKADKVAEARHKLHGNLAEIGKDIIDGAETIKVQYAPKPKGFGKGAANAENFGAQVKVVKSSKKLYKKFAKSMEGKTLPYDDFIEQFKKVNGSDEDMYIRLIKKESDNTFRAKGLGTKEQMLSRARQSPENARFVESFNSEGAKKFGRGDVTNTKNFEKILGDGTIEDITGTEEPFITGQATFMKYIKNVYDNPKEYESFWDVINENTDRPKSALQSLFGSVYNTFGATRIKAAGAADHLGIPVNNTVKHLQQGKNKMNQLLRGGTKMPSGEHLEGIEEITKRFSQFSSDQVHKIYDVLFDIMKIAQVEGREVNANKMIKNKLDDKEMQKAARWTRKWFDKAAKRFDIAPHKFISQYVSLFQDDIVSPKKIMDAIGATRSEVAKFRLPRKGAVRPVNKNIPEILNTYLYYGLYEENVVPSLRQLNNDIERMAVAEGDNPHFTPFFKQLYENASGKLSGGRANEMVGIRKLERFLSNFSSEDYVHRKARQAGFDNVNKYLKTRAGKDSRTAIEKVRELSEKPMQYLTDKMARGIKKNRNKRIADMFLAPTYIGFLGGKWDFALRNVGQSRLTLGKLGYDNFGGGIDLIRKNRELVTEITHQGNYRGNMSHVVDILKYTKEQDGLPSGMSGRMKNWINNIIENPKTEISDAPREIKNGIMEYLTLPIRASDNVNRDLAAASASYSLDKWAKKFRNGNITEREFYHNTGLDGFMPGTRETIKDRVMSGNVKQVVAENGERYSMSEAVRKDVSLGDYKIDGTSAEALFTQEVIHGTQWNYGQSGAGWLWHRNTNPIQKMGSTRGGEVGSYALSEAARTALVFNSWFVKYGQSVAEMASDPRNTKRLVAMLSAGRLFSRAFSTQLDMNKNTWAGRQSFPDYPFIQTFKTPPIEAAYLVSKLAYGNTFAGEKVSKEAWREIGYFMSGTVGRPIKKDAELLLHSLTGKMTDEEIREAVQANLGIDFKDKSAQEISQAIRQEIKPYEGGTKSTGISNF